MTQSDPLEDENHSPAFLNFDPAGLEIEWPISAFNDKSTPDDARYIDDKSESRRNSQPANDRRELVLKQETNGGQSANELESGEEAQPEAYVNRPAVTNASSSTQPFPRSELAANHRDDPMDDVGRQVASVLANMNQGFANHLPHAAPAAPNEKPTLLALSCFAAGVARCFVLHTLLLLTLGATHCQLPSAGRKTTSQEPNWVPKLSSAKRSAAAE